MDFKHPELWGEKILLFKPPSLWYFVMAALANLIQHTPAQKSKRSLCIHLVLALKLKKGVPGRHSWLRCPLFFFLLPPPPASVLTLDFNSDNDLTVRESKPRVRLHTDSVELAWGSSFSSLSAPPLLVHACVHSQKEINLKK